MNNSILVKINKSIKNKITNSNSKNHKNNEIISTGKTNGKILKKNKKCSLSRKKTKRIIKPFIITLNSNQKEK